MTDRKPIVSSFIVLLAACLSLTVSAVAEESQPTDEYAPGFYYTVQKGDTLWDLSRKFYDSEWQWPALWGQNKDLSNPHLIYPGQRIRLYQRTPSLQPSEAADIAAETAMPGEEQLDLLEQPLPETVYYMYPSIAYIGFIEKLDPEKGFFEEKIDDPIAMGSILKAVGEKKQMISENDTVYITPETANGVNYSSFIVGTRYYIYPPLIKVTDPVTGEYVGHQYKIIGTAEVTAVEDTYIKARITKSLDTINAGYFLMPFEKRDKEIAIQPTPPGITGEVLKEEGGAEMASGFSIIFINKGSEDGLEPGQRFDIYHPDKDMQNGREVLLAPYVYGQLLVLLTKEKNATAIITKAIKPVRRGDLFKSPE